MSGGGGDGERKVVWESGIEIKPVYGPQDLADHDAAAQEGDPGAFPFTRGIHAQMYRKQPWTMRQYAGYGSPADSNARFRFLIDNGQTALNVAFDLPSQLGLDSDDPRAEGEVGRVGMAVDTLADMETAFEGIALDQISTSLTINAPATIMMAMYFVAAEKRGYDLGAIRGTAQNDILKEYVGRGTWIYPVDASVRLIGDTIEYCANHVPTYSPVSVCGYHIRESGATPAQEMGFAFEIAGAYIHEVLRRGIDIDVFASRLSFNFDIFGNLWENVAKFRAGRRRWARMLRDEFGAKNPKSQWMRMIAGGGGFGLTVEEPLNNLVRGAYYALASALGGAQTMALCCYDEAYTIPTAQASLLSLRTMQILADEIGLTDTVDPLAGSYFVESTTDAMDEAIGAVQHDVRARGGIANLIANGTLQREMARQAYEEVRRLQNGERVKVGRNKYVQEDAAKTPVPLNPYDRSVADAAIATLTTIKAERDGGAVERALHALTHAAEAGTNTMHPIMECVRAYATVGEICDALRAAFGEFQEPTI
jgi:methylmalonyl-CoA mutase, N-terminal domain